MLSLAEWFQTFHRYAVENELSASARTMFYTLLGEINANYWHTNTVSTSVRRMQELGGFQSSSIVDRAKTVLSTENIVKIKKLKNRKNQYELIEPQFWLRNTSGTLAEHLRDTSGTIAEQTRDTAYSSTLPKTKQEDGKTERRKDIIEKEKNAPARAYHKSRAYIEYFGLELDADWIEKWEDDYICDDLTPKDLKTLSELQKQYGIEKLKTAMEAAHDKYGRYTRAGAVKVFLENPPPEKKGEKKNGRTDNTFANNRKFGWDD